MDDFWNTQVMERPPRPLVPADMAVDALLEQEAQRAAQTNDGNRAWVIRDAMKEQRTPVPAHSCAVTRSACSTRLGSR